MINILVNGTFDVIHPGHIALLNYAKSLGNHLTVAIDSDQRVRKLKGSDRPIHNEFERTTLLKNLRAVDSVLVFNTDAELIDIVSKCSIMVKGSDYQGQAIIGESVCPKIVFFNRLNEYSSTKTIQRISSRR